MPIVDEIVMLTAEFYGSQDSRMESICAAVCQQLTAQLRRGVTVEACRESFVHAAALLALSYLRALQDDQIDGFDAGTLKLSFADRSDRLSTIAGELMAPWCGKEEIVFRGVSG